MSRKYFIFCCLQCLFALGLIIYVAFAHQVAMDFEKRHMRLGIVISESVVVFLMMLDVTLYIMVKRGLKQPLHWWVYLDIVCIVVSVALFLYIYIKPKDAGQTMLEMIVLLSRYVFQMIRLTLQLKRYAGSHPAS